MKRQRVKPTRRRLSKTGEAMIQLPNEDRTRVDEDLITDLVTINNHLRLHSSMKKLYESIIASWYMAIRLQRPELPDKILLYSDMYRVAELIQDKTMLPYLRDLERQAKLDEGKAPIDHCIDYHPGYTTDDWFLDNPNPYHHWYFDIQWNKRFEFKEEARDEWYEPSEHDVYNGMLTVGTKFYKYYIDGRPGCTDEEFLLKLKERGLPRDLLRIEKYYELFPEKKASSDAS